MLLKWEARAFFSALIIATIVCIMAIVMLPAIDVVEILDGILVMESIVAAIVYLPRAISVRKYGFDGVTLARLGIVIQWVASALSLGMRLYQREFTDIALFPPETFFRDALLMAWSWSAILMVVAVGVMDKRPVRWNVCAVIWAGFFGGATALAIRLLHHQFGG